MVLLCLRQFRIALPRNVFAGVGSPSQPVTANGIIRVLLSASVSEPSVREIFAKGNVLIAQNHSFLADGNSGLVAGCIVPTNADRVLTLELIWRERKRERLR